MTSQKLQANDTTSFVPLITATDSAVTGTITNYLITPAFSTHRFANTECDAEEISNDKVSLLCSSCDICYY